MKKQNNKKKKENVPEIFSKNVEGSYAILKNKTVGIAGCGGLGSNIAVALTRSGVGNLILVDYDIIEPSNLNRQYYFQKDIGELKALALANILKEINPDVNLEVHIQELKPKDVSKIFKNVDILMEAFDKAESKKWLIDTWCQKFPDKPIICGSGMSGIGKTDMLKVNTSGNLIVCGDQFSTLKDGLSAARVAIVANMQANEAVNLLINK